MKLQDVIVTTSDQRQSDPHHDDARINAEVRANRLGRPSGAVRSSLIDRRIRQYQMTTTNPDQQEH